MCNFQGSLFLQVPQGTGISLEREKISLNDNEACKERPLLFLHNETESFFDISLEHPLAMIGIISPSREYTLWIR